MDSSTWVNLLGVIAAVATGLIGILFAWIRSSLIRLDDKIEQKFTRLDTKLAESDRENHSDMQDVRNQIQSVLKASLARETERTR